MSEDAVTEVGHIRSVLRYLKRFAHAIIVIYIDDRVIDTPLYVNHIRDIAMLHEAGLKPIIVPGARKRIDEVLERAHIPWTIVNGCRITGSEAMPLIKMAAFDTSNRIMTSLAGEKKTPVNGNWVRARGRGIVDGFDYGTSGAIDRIQTDALYTVLEAGFIPIFPSIGWSIAGKPYNISSVQLAAETAAAVKAHKLFFMIQDAYAAESQFIIPPQYTRSQDGRLAAMNAQETKAFLELNGNGVEKGGTAKEHILKLLETGLRACTSGVERVHIVDGSQDGSLPAEIFSDFGSGTMIYRNTYGSVRAMTADDIPDVLALMRPFIERGILLARTEENLAAQYQDYIVYELDGAIRACAALHLYDGRQAEIAGVAVDENCSHMGIGPYLITHLCRAAAKAGAHSVFVLTTQTADWFEQQGFTPDDIETLPEKRRALWSAQRRSRLLRKSLL